jgi:arsenite methyltransferase
MANSRNSDLVRGGQARVVQAAADDLPFEDNFFDKAMAVHVLYFWRDLAGPLKELARVLKPGGILVLLFRSQGDPRVAAFPEKVYTFRTVAAVTTALEAAGFRIDKINPPQVGVQPSPIVVKAVRTSGQPLRQ